MKLAEAVEHIRNLFTRATVKITKNDRYHLLAKVSGEEINFEKHHFKMEIKAPTYHLMEIKDEKPVLMQFILDL